MVMGGDLAWAGEHTMQYTDDVSQNCSPGTSMILQTFSTTVSSIKIKKKKKKDTTCPFCKYSQSLFMVLEAYLLGFKMEHLPRK